MGREALTDRIIDLMDDLESHMEDCDAPGYETLVKCIHVLEEFERRGWEPPDDLPYTLDQLRDFELWMVEYDDEDEEWHGD